MTNPDEIELLQDIRHELKLIRIILELDLSDQDKHQIDEELAKEFGE
jgi:hypothetical protein